MTTLEAKRKLITGAAISMFFPDGSVDVLKNIDIFVGTDTSETVDTSSTHVGILEADHKTARAYAYLSGTLTSSRNAVILAMHA